jgi:hypothetical protein
MARHPFQRRSIPLWQIVPLILLPPAVVAAVSLYFDLPLTPFLYTCALTAAALLLLVAPRSRLRWALAAAVAVLGFFMLVTGVNIIDWAAAAFTWVSLNLRAGA